MADTNLIWLAVARDFTNRIKQEPDDGPLATAAHNKRKEVLEEDLNDPSYNVKDWDKTKDEKPHEDVQQLIEIINNPIVQTVATTVGAFVLNAVASGVKSIIADGVKDIWNKMTKRQHNGDISGFTVKAPVSGGGTVTIYPQQENCITIMFDATGDMNTPLLKKQPN